MMHLGNGDKLNRHLVSCVYASVLMRLLLQVL